MGGDHGCGVIVEGVKLALNANQKITQLYLVGNEGEIKGRSEPKPTSGCPGKNCSCPRKS